MNKKIASSSAIVLACVLGASVEVRAQGLIAANNSNGAGNDHSTNHGLFFDDDSTLYVATPINVTILGGPDANSLTPIVTLSGPNALVQIGPGRYADPSGRSYVVPGVAPGEPATLQVLAWKGPSLTFAGSDYHFDWFFPWAGDRYADPTAFTFINQTGVAQGVSLDGMPAMVRVTGLPEPNAAWLMLLGLPWLFFHRRRKG